MTECPICAQTPEPMRSDLSKHCPCCLYAEAVREAERERLMSIIRDEWQDESGLPMPMCGSCNAPWDKPNVEDCAVCSVRTAIRERGHR